MNVASFCCDDIRLVAWCHDSGAVAKKGEHCSQSGRGVRVRISLIACERDACAQANHRITLVKGVAGDRGLIAERLGGIVHFSQLGVLVGQVFKL